LFGDSTTSSSDDDPSQKLLHAIRQQGIATMAKYPPQAPAKSHIPAIRVEAGKEGLPVSFDQSFGIITAAPAKPLVTADSHQQRPSTLPRCFLPNPQPHDAVWIRGELAVTLRPFPVPREWHFRWKDFMNWQTQMIAYGTAVFQFVGVGGIMKI
jgi:hypothetical protein